MIYRYPDGSSSRQVAGLRLENCQQAFRALVDHIEAGDTLGIKEVLDERANDAERFWLFRLLSGRQKAVVNQYWGRPASGDQ
jgi:hypothetical protein